MLGEYVVYSPVIAARMAAGLSQAQFASLMDVSVRTLQDWEQGRRQPSGAARTLIKVAERYPEVLRELAAQCAVTVFPISGRLRNGNPPPLFWKNEAHSGNFLE